MINKSICYDLAFTVKSALVDFLRQLACARSEFSAISDGKHLRNPYVPRNLGQTKLRRKPRTSDRRDGDAARCQFVLHPGEKFPSDWQLGRGYALKLAFSCQRIDFEGPRP